MPNYPTYIYLHGFASSPHSAKAKYLRECFQRCQIDIKVPDLNQGDFSHLTLTRQLKQVEAEFPPAPAPVAIIGSSFGGLTAAWLGQRHRQVQRLVLLAPAFQFISHWLPILGEEKVQRWQTEKYLPLYHYGEKQSLPLHYEFVLDMRQYQEQHLLSPVSTLILHGRHDEVIPIQASRDFAATRPWVRLVELDSDHALGNVLDEIWQEICQFLEVRY
ncbi:MAG: alpha/beta hydrolase [Oscillatoria sp. Prado101]|nr:alpha/beta hydrolase [Oscillatoria sp. Prado101]